MISMSNNYLSRFNFPRRVSTGSRRKQILFELSRRYRTSLLSERQLCVLYDMRIFLGEPTTHDLTILFLVSTIVESSLSRWKQANKIPRAL
jgi:hypothetical protein